jgi:hypothetical protein
MLKITDFGCNQHQLRQFTFFSGEADLISDILYNLPKEGNSHIYICEHGHTHYVIFQMQPSRIAAGPKAAILRPDGSVRGSSKNSKSDDC